MNYTESAPIRQPVPELPDHDTDRCVGKAFGLSMAMTWTFAKQSWGQIDWADPRKAFVQEVFTTVKASLRKFARNGAGSHSDEKKPPSLVLDNDGDKAPN